MKQRNTEQHKTKYNNINLEGNRVTPLVTQVCDEAAERAEEKKQETTQSKAK
jgi:hypothetical protein